VGNVRDEDPVGIALITGDPHGGSACGGVHGGGIDAKVDLAIIGVDEALTGSSGFGLVRYVAVSGVRSGVEVKG